MSHSHHSGVLASLTVAAVALLIPETADAQFFSHSAKNSHAAGVAPGGAPTDTASAPVNAAAMMTRMMAVTDEFKDNEGNNFKIYGSGMVMFNNQYNIGNLGTDGKIHSIPVAPMMQDAETKAVAAANAAYIIYKGSNGNKPTLAVANNNAPTVVKTEVRKTATDITSDTSGGAGSATITPSGEGYIVSYKGGQYSGDTVEVQPAKISIHGAAKEIAFTHTGDFKGKTKTEKAKTGLKLIAGAAESAWTRSGDTGGVPSLVYTQNGQTVNLTSAEGSGTLAKTATTTVNNLQAPAQEIFYTVKLIADKNLSYQEPKLVSQIAEYAPRATGNQQVASLGNGTN